MGRLAVTGDVPVTVAEAEPHDPTIKLEQVKVTAPVNPPAGVTVIVALLDCPAATVTSPLLVSAKPSGIGNNVAASTTTLRLIGSVRLLTVLFEFSASE